MHAQFRTYRLNGAGQQKAEQITQAFSELLTKLEAGLVPEGYQLGLCRNLLEQACFFAKKGMAMDVSNQEGGQGDPQDGRPKREWAMEGSTYGGAPSSTALEGK